MKKSHVYVRPIRVDDVNDDYVSWLNDPEVTYFLDTHHVTLEEQKKYVADKLKKDDCCFLGVFASDSDELIGTAKFEPIEEVSRVAQFGIFMGNKRHWGHGLGLEATNEALRYGFTELNISRAELGVYAANVQAFKTFLRAGFEVTRRDIRPGNEGGESWHRIRMVLDRSSWPRPENKICLFAQRNFARVLDSFAAALLARYPSLKFCAFVHHRNALTTIRGSKLVPYSSLLLEEDIIKEYKSEKLDLDYIRSIELSYGIPNLWPFFVGDRILMQGQLIREYPHDTSPYSHEELLRIAQVLSKRIERFLDEEKPRHLVCNIIGSLGTSLLYYMARARGVKVHYICSTQFESRFLFSSMHNDTSLKVELKEAYSSPARSDIRDHAREFLRRFRDRPMAPFAFQTPEHQQTSRKKQFQFLSPSKIVASISALLHEFIVYYRNPFKDDYSVVKPHHYLYDRIRRKLRNLKSLTDLYDAPGDEPYAFFPLHYEPEVTVSIWSPGLGDQIDSVTRAARSLPVGWKLYVKEHPQMAGYRQRRFYEQLKKIPNVKLINPAVSSFGLIQNGKLIITLTSTVGFEAVLLGKPVLTLGNNWVNDLSFVKHCENLTDLPLLVKEQTERFSYDEEEVIHFLSKLIESSTVIDILSLWYSEKSTAERLRGIEPLVDLFAKRIGLPA